VLSIIATPSVSPQLASGENILPQAALAPMASSLF